MTARNGVKEKEWFRTWFGSLYYDILYKHRDEEEAYSFIDNLIKYLNPPEGAKMLDLACGKGRHSIFLAEKGFDVTGLDLSQDQIAEAKKHEKTNLRFQRHDMRDPFSYCGFDYIFNFFTSFGYFEDELDNFKVMRNVAHCLKDSGTFILDFMNVQYIASNMVPEDNLFLQGINFNIKRRMQNGYILKDIGIRDDGKTKEFQERVKALTLEDFKKYLNDAGLVIKKLFGDYRLNEYKEKTSNRLIIISEKSSK